MNTPSMPNEIIADTGKICYISKYTLWRQLSLVIYKQYLCGLY